MGGNYISGNASHFFFSPFSPLTQIEGFVHLEIMASFSNHGFSSIGDSSNTFDSNSFSFSSSNDDGMYEMFTNMDIQKQCAFVTIVVVANSCDMFNANELEDGASHSMDSSVGVQNVFATMQATPRLFKTLTNFTLAEFDKLALLMAPTIVRHA
jgi:hypothetical protein